MDSEVIYIKPTLSRPPFSVVATFLWGQETDFDSDGNSITPSDASWTELTLISRADRIERVDITPSQTSPLVLKVASNGHRLAHKVAYFISITTDGEVSYSPESEWTKPESLVSTVSNFNLYKATLEAIWFCQDNYPNINILSPDYVAAHKKSIRHRDELCNSEICGCFHCLKIFHFDEVEEWLNEREGPNLTAVCPNCGIDSVIGSASGYSVNENFLRKMNKCWF